MSCKRATWIVQEVHNDERLDILSPVCGEQHYLFILHHERGDFQSKEKLSIYLKPSHGPCSHGWDEGHTRVMPLQSVRKEVTMSFSPFPMQWYNESIMLCPLLKMLDMCKSVKQDCMWTILWTNPWTCIWTSLLLSGSCHVMLIDTSQISGVLSITYTAEQNMGWQAWHGETTRQSQATSMHKTKQCLLIVDKASMKQKLF